MTTDPPKPPPFSTRVKASCAWWPEHGLRYWLTSLVILIATIWAEPYIDDRLNLADVKNQLFQTLSASTTNPSIPQTVRLINIGDDQFWTGAMHHRSPTDRAYLASLIRALDVADASVIALDFNLEMPVPLDRVRLGDYASTDFYAPYRAETATLIRTVDDVAQRRAIVLAKSMQGPVDGPFRLTLDSYQPFGLCVRLTGDGTWYSPGTHDFPLAAEAQRNINCGYIALMTDKRRVPPPATIVDNPAHLDSFSLAVVRGWLPDRRFDSDERELYASYIPEAVMASQAVMSAGELLRDPIAARVRLRGHPVIIGSGWHQYALGRGPMIDLHATPIGAVSGALIHVNMAEAMISHRTYAALPEQAKFVVEVGLAIGAAILFALIPSWWLATIALIGAMAVLLGLQWVSLQLFGTFLDLFGPILGLGLHAIVDRLVGVE